MRSGRTSARSHERLPPDQSVRTLAARTVVHLPISATVGGNREPSFAGGFAGTSCCGGGQTAQVGRCVRPSVHYYAVCDTWHPVCLGHPFSDREDGHPAPALLLRDQGNWSSRIPLTGRGAGWRPQRDQTSCPARSSRSLPIRWRLRASTRYFAPSPMRFETD
jgi:hypothetical protein